MRPFRVWLAGIILGQKGWHYILEEMSREVLGSRKKRRSALTDVLTELPLPPPPPPDDHEDEFDLEDELDSEPGEQ